MERITKPREQKYSIVIAEDVFWRSIIRNNEKK
jgi:hypothetical protein